MLAVKKYMLKIRHFHESDSSNIWYRDLSNGGCKKLFLGIFFRSALPSWHGASGQQKKKLKLETMTVTVPQAYIPARLWWRTSESPFSLSVL